MVDSEQDQGLRTVVTELAHSYEHAAKLCSASCETLSEECRNVTSDLLNLVGQTHSITIYIHTQNESGDGDLPYTAVCPATLYHVKSDNCRICVV